VLNIVHCMYVIMGIYFEISRL